MLHAARQAEASFFFFAELFIRLSGREYASLGWAEDQDIFL